jgi:hypothetical protein
MSVLSRKQQAAIADTTLVKMVPLCSQVTLTIVAPFASPAVVAAVALCIQNLSSGTAVLLVALSLGLKRAL